MRNLGVVVGLVLLTGIGALAAQKAAPASTDTAGIAKVRAAYQTAAAAQDPAAIARLFAPDGEEMPPNSPTVKGRPAIEAYHKQFAQQFMVHGITITGTDTHVTGSVGYDVGTYKQTLMAQQGGAMFEDHGKYIVLLKKDAGAWVITHLIYNSDLPTMGAAKK